MEASLLEFEKFQTHLPYSKSTRPNKVHIGLVQLSTDHTLENDWALLSKNNASIFSTRVHYNSELNIKDLQAIAQGIQSASKLIAVGLALDVMVFGCTSASLVIGEEKVTHLLTQERDFVPATNPWTASKEAFRFLKAEKIGIFSPYPTAVNRFLYQKLSQAGFDVSALVSLGIQNDTDVTLISKESMQKGIEALLSKTSLDLIFMSCTNLRVLEHLEEFERLYQVPIVSSNSALFWHAMKLAQKEASCPGYGTLLSPTKKE